MLKNKFLPTLFILVVVMTISVTPPALAQLPFIQDLAIYSRAWRQGDENSLNSACIRLDGHCLFKLAATDSEVFIYQN